MNDLKLKGFTTLIFLTLTLILFLFTSCDNETDQKISIVKSERIQEKHAEIALQKSANPNRDTGEAAKDAFKEITESHRKAEVLEETVLPLSEFNNSSSPKYGIINNQLDISKSILNKVDSNKGHKKRPLRIAYFNPKDRKAVQGYEQRIQKIMLELQSFYAKGMEQNGFGYRTFDLEMNREKLKIHFVQSSKPAKSYARDSNTSQEIYLMTSNKLKESGIDAESETVIVFQNLAKIEANSFYDTAAPYYGTWNTNNNRKGFCYVVDSKYLNWKNLTANKENIKFNGERTMTLAQLASGQIGGVCHELGHAFCLNHTHSSSIQNQKYGTALMGYGNWSFKEEIRQEGKGSYLSFISAAKLMGHPCFSEIKKGKSELQITDLSFNTMSSILEIQGTLFSTPDVYGLIAYCDDLEKASDYDATGWVGSVDNMGKFQISINELLPNKSYTLNLQYLFVNGREYSEKIPFATNSSGVPELENGLKEKIVLRQAIQAKLKNIPDKSEELLNKLTSTSNSKSINFLAHSIKVMDKQLNLVAATIPETQKEVFLSQIKWDNAFTGYSSPRSNRVHDDSPNKPWPFLVSNKNIHRFGLYAHANSEYTYKLGGKWKKLSGKCALKKGMKGSVNFIITGDGKELYNSGRITDSNEYEYNIRLEGIDTIQLIVNDSGDGKNSDWGQWLSPKLSR